jgi:hypothetical protein
VATASKQSALAKLAAKTGTPSKTALPGGNGSAGAPVIRPVAKPATQPFAQTAIVGHQPQPAQIGNRPAQAVAGSSTIKPIVQPTKPPTVIPPTVIPSIEVPVTVVPAPVVAPKPILTAQPQKSVSTMAAAGSSLSDPSMTRTSFIRNLLPADQTQLVIVKDAAPAAKILREVR